MKSREMSVRERFLNLIQEGKDSTTEICKILNKKKLWCMEQYLYMKNG